LVARCGFSLAGARASPDGHTVFIAYECAPGRERDTASALEGAAGPLRSAVARALKTRRAPRLRFARDAPTEAEAAVLAELDRIEREEGG
jgi:ribosome-binding factor A